MLIIRIGTVSESHEVRIQPQGRPIRRGGSDEDGASLSCGDDSERSPSAGGNDNGCDGAAYAHGHDHAYAHDDGRHRLQQQER